MKLAKIPVALSIALISIAACQRNSIPPEESAEKFAKDLGLNMQGKPNCTQVDTDNDGYVTCTLAVKDRSEAPVRTVSLQCAGVTGESFSCNPQTKTYAVGCKDTMPRMPGGTSN